MAAEKWSLGRVAILFGGSFILGIVLVLMEPSDSGRQLTFWRILLVALLFSLGFSALLLAISFVSNFLSGVIQRGVEKTYRNADGRRVGRSHLLVVAGGVFLLVILVDALWFFSPALIDAVTDITFRVRDLLGFKFQVQRLN